MSSYHDVCDIENNKKKRNRIFQYIRGVFKKIVIAGDNKNSEEIDKLVAELKEFSDFDIYYAGFDEFKGIYVQLSEGIYKLIEAANVIKKTMNLKYRDLNSGDFNGWKIIEERTRYQKYNGPLFLYSHGDIVKEIEKRDAVINNIDDYVNKIMDLSFNQMTKELPDYYEMYQVTDDVNFEELINADELAEIITTSYNINPENIELINNYFTSTIDDKTYQIFVSHSPFMVTIKCSDGRQIKADYSFKTVWKSFFDVPGSYPVYETYLSLYFPTRYNINLKCTARIENEYKLETDAKEIIKNLSDPTTPNGKQIDWKYIAYHEDDYFSEEELSVLSQEFTSFIKGITNSDPQERINTLVKTLGTKQIKETN